MRNKKGQAQIASYAIIGMFILFGWYILAGPGAAKDVDLIPDGENGGDGLKIDVCSNPSVTGTIGPLSVWKQTTSVTATANGTVWRNPDDNYQSSTVYTSGGSDTFSGLSSDPDTLEIVYGLDSLRYWSSKASKITVPCTSFETKKEDGGASVLVQNGTLTWTVFNGDTNNQNPGDGTENETVGASDTANFDIRFTTQAYTGVSPVTPGRPGSKMFLMAEFNDTTYDKSKAFLAGVPPTSFSEPSYFTPATVDSAFALWELDGCPDTTTGDGKVKCDENLGRLSIDTKSTNANPGTGCTIGGGAVILRLIPQDYYKHTITSQPLFGIEKNDGTIPNSNLDYTGQSQTLCVT